MANDVTYQRPDYEAALNRWRLVRDVCAGSEAVKAAGDKYLPRPNATDKSAENQARYLSYLARAVFYNATGRTEQGLTGTVFRVVPTLETPTLIDYVKSDVDGAGNSIYQQSQAVLSDVLATGRAFLLADYPSVGGSTSRADQLSGRIRATIAAYTAEAVINWRTDRVGAEHMLTLVVISESHEEQEGFGAKQIPQMRVLRLVEGVYSVEIWRQEVKGGWVIVGEPMMPLRSNGRPWDRIPGTFVGAQNNDPTVDQSPLYDLAELNIGHYRNSADYEDSVYFCGQPQVFMAGLDEQWVKLLQAEGIYFGSRAMLPLPVGGSAGILQAAPNTLCKEAMADKERQMVSLGARLIEKGGAVKTATQATAENAAEHSVLSLCASNVSEAYTKALQFAAEFMDATGEVVYQLNQDFVDASLDAQLLTSLVDSWQKGAITDADLWQQFRRVGLVDAEKTDDEIREELESSTGGLSLDVDNGDSSATG